MSLDIRPMRADEAGHVAGMVRGLAEHIGTDVVPKLTAETLTAARDLIDVVVADDGGRLIGACLGLMTFSLIISSPLFGFINHGLKPPSPVLNGDVLPIRFQVSCLHVLNLVALFLVSVF